MTLVNKLRLGIILPFLPILVGAYMLIEHQGPPLVGYMLATLPWAISLYSVGIEYFIGRDKDHVPHDLVDGANMVAKAAFVGAVFAGGIAMLLAGDIRLLAVLIPSLCLNAFVQVKANERGRVLAKEYGFI